MDVPDEAYDDGRIADWSVGRLKRFAADGNNTPFFLAVGFLKPHLPFVDIYPTLCDLAGLPVPSSLDGRSLVPLMKDSNTKVREFSASIYTRSNEHGKHLGYTIRTDRYRYIGWYRYQWQSSGSLRVQGKPVATELYDYVADPNETDNLAGKPEYSNTESELAEFLQPHVDYSQSQQL